MDIDPLLKKLLNTAVRNNASDLHIKPDSPAYLRIKKILRPIADTTLSEASTERIIFSPLSSSQKKQLRENSEVDYALNIENLGRFRVNAYCSQGKYEMVLRVVNEEVFSAEKLNLPVDVLESLAAKEHGLVLVSGATGSGKSTTLSAIVDYINTNFAKRIITIENPIEIIHKNKKSLVSQREVGVDTPSFNDALRSVLRQDPDVILVGEIRDKETADAAIQAAQTGHLVLATIHAGSSEETIYRFANLFPATDREYIRGTLAGTIKGVLVQKLVITRNQTRTPALEILLNNSRTADLIEGNSAESFERVLEDKIDGMRTLDQDLARLCQQKVISPETALKEAYNRNHLMQRLKQMSLL